VRGIICSCNIPPRVNEPEDYILTANALIREASPYLRQHAHNPVDWLPWSDTAFLTAEARDKPVFLSIGYAACHWCHVMERESFEDSTIAAFLNEHFVCIKVDREERPDVDHHYMQAVQSMTGQGGWPLSVFLTPDSKPFFGGTYWPPVARWQRPGFFDILRSVADVWQSKRAELVSMASQIHESFSANLRFTGKEQEIGRDLLRNVVGSAAERFDSDHGGFGSAPKFPHAMELTFLLRYWARNRDDQALSIVLFTLERMMRGGIYDHLGGGFHRYSTDAQWHIPHFEKMLYDNALLVPVYLDAYLITRNNEFRQVAQATLDWALREMEMEEGGFASSLDADSEGQEGLFYRWTPCEIIEILGNKRGERFCSIYGVTGEDSREGGDSVPHLSESLAATAARYRLSENELAEQLAADRASLCIAREKRARPDRDEKVLTDWNGFMISALVRGYTALGDERYLSAAQHAANRLTNCFERTGRLRHSYVRERFNETQLLLDYSALGNGLLDLFMTAGDTRWFDLSVRLARTVDTLFSGESDLYAMSASPVAGTAPLDPYDSAVPSGISMAGNLFAKLYCLTGEEWYHARATGQVRPLVDSMTCTPAAFPQGLLTVELLLEPPAQLILIEDQSRLLWSVIRDRYLPHVLIVWTNSESSHSATELTSLLSGKVSLNGKPTAYLCRGFTCHQPVTSPDALAVMIDQSFGKRSAIH